MAQVQAKTIGPPLGKSKKKRHALWREIVRNRYLYLLTLPGIAYFIVFNYLPMVGLYLAFVDYSPVAPAFGLGSPFVGLSNFRFFFMTDTWIKVTINTLYLNALFISTGLLVSVTLALALNEMTLRLVKRLAQTFMFLPNFISWTVISVLAIAIFSTDGGLLNTMALRLGGQTVAYYQEPGVWPAILVILRLWKGAGFGTVIYLATISGIDQGIYEAATIDGASRFGKIWHITLPLLKTTTCMLLIMDVGKIFYGDFGMIYALVGDNALLRSTTDVIDTFVYRAMRVNNEIGMSAAVGFFQSVIGFVMVVCANAAVRWMDPESSLF